MQINWKESSQSKLVLRQHRLSCKRIYGFSCSHKKRDAKEFLSAMLTEDDDQKALMVILILQVAVHSISGSTFKLV